jgi:hypothetical protein
VNLIIDLQGGVKGRHLERHRTLGAHHAVL